MAFVLPDSRGCNGNYLIIDSVTNRPISASTKIDGTSFDDVCHTYTLYCDTNKNNGVDGADIDLGSTTMTLQKYNPSSAPTNQCECTTKNIQCASGSGTLFGCCQYAYDQSNSANNKCTPSISKTSCLDTEPKGKFWYHKGQCDSNNVCQPPS